MQQPLGIYERFHLSALNDVMVIRILKWNFYYYWEWIGEWKKGEEVNRNAVDMQIADEMKIFIAITNMNIPHYFPSTASQGFQIIPFIFYKHNLIIFSRQHQSWEWSGNKWIGKLTDDVTKNPRGIEINIKMRKGDAR